MLFGVLLLLTVALSADRYWAVCHPISYFKNENSGLKLKIIVLSSVIGIFSGSLPALGMANSATTTCFFIEVLGLKYLIICVAWSMGSCVAIVTFYSLIYKSLSAQVCFLNGFRASSLMN